jgi:hypothetical protein
MAQNLLFTYTILVANSPYAAGDKVYTYWDDSTLAFVVKTDANVETFGSNISLNGDTGNFETVSSGWFSSYIQSFYELLNQPDFTLALSRSNTFAHAGTYSTKYIQPNTFDNLLFIQAANLTVGKTYRVTCWVYSVSATAICGGTSRAVLSLAPADDQINVSMSYGNQVNVTVLDCANTWKQISVDVTLLNSGLQPHIYLKVTGYSTMITNGILHIDEFFIKEATGYSIANSTITTGPDLGYPIASRTSRWYVDNAKPYTLPSDTGGGSKTITSLYEFCTGTTLTNFSVVTANPSFPYGIKELTANSVSCAATPLVCDIRFIESAVIAKSSNPFSPDGQIRATAVSSFSNIRYGLFNSTPTGDYSTFPQTSGLFTGLIPGTYTIWASDSNNCRASTTIVLSSTINNNPPPSDTNISDVKYRMEHKDTQNLVTARVDILERGFISTLTEVNGSESPFIRTLPSISVNNKFEILRPTNAMINLMSPKDLQFMGLFSQDDRKYQIKYYKPVGTLLWSGFIVPSIFSQPYIENPPYVTSIAVSDNLNELNNLDYLDKDGNIQKGNKSLIKIVAFCLEKLSLGLGIRVACNVKENTHPLTASIAFENTFQDQGSFYENDGTPWKCGRVLESIIGPFMAKLVQENGVWNIVRIEEQTATYSYRQYDKDGVFVSTSTYNPVIAISSPSLRLNAIFVDYNSTLSMVPAYGKITIKRNLRLVENLVENGSFDISNFANNVLSGWSVKLIDTSSATVRPFWTIETILIRKEGTGPVENDTSYALTIGNIDGNKNSALSSRAILTSNKFPLIYSDVDMFLFSFEYRINLVDASRIVDWPRWIKLAWTINLGDKYFNEKLGWSTTLTYNYIFIDRFFSNEKKEVSAKLPVRIKGSIEAVQLIFVIYGSNEVEYTAGNVTAIASNSYITGHKICGKESNNYLWYTLKGGTNATSLPGIGRPSDYAASTNESVWVLDETTVADSVKVGKIYIDNVRFNFLPNSQKPPEVETLSSIINKNFREDLVIDFESGDVPTATAQEIHSKEYIYNNFFKDSAGNPTTAWTRDSVPAESLTIQKIALKSLITQYQYPTFKVSGSLLGFSELNFLTTFKHSQTQPVLVLTNEEFTGSLTGWSDIGSDWTYNSNKARLATLAASTNSTNLWQSASFESGQRISVEFNITRSSSSGTRDDWFSIVLMSGLTNVQQIVGQSMSNDGTWTKTIKFTVSQACTAIGFYVRWINGTGTCVYDVDYFRLDGLIVTRYFTVDGMEIDGKSNSYTAELMQLVPVIPSADPLVDDSGEGNTGTEGGAGGGLGTGSSFSGDFNADFGGDFDTILN